MTTAWSVRRWSSIGGNAARGYELVSQPVAPQAFRAALAFLATAVPVESAFVLVRLAGGDDVANREAIEAANESTLSQRLCVAVDQSTLTSVDFSDLNNERVGLVLDSIDADTPLAAIAHDSIEAIRFSSDFVRRASGNLRQSCLLEAMSGFARNLGLCTLGPQVDRSNHLIAPGLEFDYVPDYPADAPVEVATALSNGAQGGSNRTIHLTR